MQREGQLREEGVGLKVRQPYKKPELKQYGRLEDVVQNGSFAETDASLFGSSTF